MFQNKLNKLEKQYGGEIPFSSLTRKKKQKKKSYQKKIKRSVSPNRKRRKITKQTSRTKKRNRTKKIKKCSCGAKIYTGKELTPRGLGKCEECYPLKVVLRGKDDELYENRKNGWFKLT
ncbi:MAG: hypothetical protein CMD29_03240 [Flavobacteriales bacterium]|nr:hypothetical protein [Flavobacteriales bacterium]|tara:strand:- start:1294 stop:1650 length:357 start_codon:yes stop_codon:yes gene_type:complete